jgi:phosphogluconate dehydratase
MNKTIQQITERIINRSKNSRQAYIQQMQLAEKNQRSREIMSCGNLAHAFAACDDNAKNKLTGNSAFNLAIVSAYNDMLSAHKPYENYPDQLRKAAAENGAVAQFAGGVPAMCDGVTQGQAGMELSLLSRDVIAMSTVIALSHNMFDATICLGICDKIVPGLLIGSLKFGHLPTIFIPGGPMETGISNEEKAKIREDFARGIISREELLKGESAAYHSAGTCTFYGTANSNQMLMEIMGLHLPGSSFVNPTNPLRSALTAEAVKQLIEITTNSHKVPLYKIIDEKTIVNGIIGLLATGGSTNHTIHLVAIAKAAGIIIDWEDFSELSKVTPSITKVYPNGTADINHFHAAGGMSIVIKSLLEKELLHEDVWTVKGKGLTQYCKEPFLKDNKIEYRTGPKDSLDHSVISPIEQPFDPEGGIKLITGNMGVSVCKISAVRPKNRFVEAPAIVFNDQNEFVTAFNNGELNKDFIVVIRFQGPKSNGMPELHKLTPMLSILQHNGHKVALVTDGRMSGASGKVPSAIHLSPEAKDGGILPLLRDGDKLLLDCEKGKLECLNIDEV